MKLFSTRITINRDIKTVFDYYRTMSNINQFLPQNTTLENINFEEGEHVELGKAYYAKMNDSDETYTLQVTLTELIEYEHQLYEFKIIEWEEEEDEDLSDIMNFFNLNYRLVFKNLSTNKVKIKQTYFIEGVPFWIKIIVFLQMVPEYFQTRRDNKLIKAELENLQS